MTASTRWSLRLGRLALAVLGGMGGWLPGYGLALGFSSPNYSYGVTTFLTSAAVVWLAFQSLEHVPKLGGLAYSATMILAGALNGALTALHLLVTDAAFLWADVSNLLPLVVFGGFVGAVCGLVYTAVFAPAASRFSWLSARPSLRAGGWTVATVGFSYLFAGGLAALLLRAVAGLESRPGALDPVLSFAVGVASVGVVVMLGGMLRIGFVRRAARGGRGDSERLSASELGLDASQLPALHPAVAEDAAFVLVRADRSDDRPYRGTVQRVPYARVD